MSNLRVPWSLKNELDLRCLNAQCIPCQATATAKAIVEAKACISARQVQPQMGDHVT